MPKKKKAAPAKKASGAKKTIAKKAKAPASGGGPVSIEACKS